MQASTEKNVLPAFVGTRYGTSSQYYYGDYRTHYRYPWPERSLSASLKDMNAVDQEDRISVRQKLASSSGFTGLSILHRLSYLYQFDVLKDLVVDAMHNIPLNVVRAHMHRYLQEGFLSDPMVERRLRAMPWTAGNVCFLNPKCY